MNISAFYHKSCDQYCYALNEEELVINLITGKDIKKVEIKYGDPYISGIAGGNWQWDGDIACMNLEMELKYHYVWSITLKPAYKRLKYFFMISDDVTVVNYLEEGILTDEELSFRLIPRMFNYAWLNSIDVIKTPDWVKNTMWYQIFPERFMNGNKDNDPSCVIEWDSKDVMSNDDFYGGDLQGIIDKLDYIKDLGLNGIYMTPVFEAQSSHKYDTTDYFKVDSMFGTNEDLKTLISEAHEKGIKVMLDVVFNHCGPKFAPWLDVLEKKEQSVYKDWFIVNDFDDIAALRDTKDGRFYSFAFSNDMPKLNTNNLEVQNYLLDCVRFYIEEFDCDGLRLDVANEVSHDFWKKMHRLCKELKPDFYILGEIWYNSSEWLRGDEFDSVMNYPFTTSILNFFHTKSYPVSNLIQELNDCYMMYPRQVNDVMFNLLDSHDTQRISNLDSNVDVIYQQLLMLFTSQGTPSVFYGTEILMHGAHDPHCRRCMPWKQIDDGIYDEKITMFKRLTKLRSDYSCLNSGKLSWNTHENNRVIEYIKQDSNQKLRIIINASSEHLDIKVGKVVLANKFDKQLEPNGFIVEELE